jgi:hypothetical protein
MKAIILLSIMTFLLISCDGNRSGSGIIREVTSQPIDKVKYFSLHDDQSVSYGCKR